MIRFARFLFLFGIFVPMSGRADLTLVQKVEGMDQPAEMIIRIKGDKARIDSTPQMSTIVDGKSGEMTNLMKDQKAVIHISAEKIRVAADMISKYSGKKETIEKPKFVPTGKKEIVNGYQTEEYVCETPTFKAAFWIAPKYPDGAAILKQLQALNSEVWKTNNMNMPDYRDFPGLPIKTVVSIGGNQITSTVTSVKQDALSDAEFSVPKDYHEIKVPEIGELLQPGGKKPATGSSPAP